MKITIQIAKELLTLKDRPKFTTNVWNEKGLIPSSPVVIEMLENNVNQFIEKIITNNEITDISEIFLPFLSELDEIDLDTEEIELYGDYISEIEAILQKNLSKIFFEWQYKINLNDFKKNEYETKYTVNHYCIGCNTELILQVRREKQGNPTFGIIAQCNNCDKIQLLSFPENIDIYINGKYFVFEKIETNNNDELAISRLNFFIDANKDE